jgi:hypothetical protein
MGRLEVYSVNYDFMPTIINSAKTLWVDLKFPPTDSGLKIGTNVRLVSSNPNLKVPDDIIQVLDIVGTRVVLTTVNRNVKTSYESVPKYTPTMNINLGPSKEAWHPTKHSQGTWGYSTRKYNWNHTINNPNTNWLFGQGDPIAFLLF